MTIPNNMKPLVGAATRYISGRNAVQTVYWRTSPGAGGRMLKYNKTCEFDRSQKLPASMRLHNSSRSFPGRGGSSPRLQD